MTEKSPEPGEILRQMRELRRETRKARHAYWGPLILFGLLICLSAPFYGSVARAGPRSGIVIYTAPRVLGIPCSPVICGPSWNGTGWGYYWLLALPAGLLLTAIWYRWHARRVGLATPSRGYVITTAVLAVLALFSPLFAHVPGLSWLSEVPRIWPADLVIRGMMPFLVIAAGLWALAWAERSRGIVITGLIFTSAAFLASLYDVENLLARLGWNPAGSDWRLASLPNVLLPGLVLLIAGLAAWITARLARGRSGGAEPARPVPA